MIIGAQLYTLREYTKTLDDFAETLKKVADIGYTTVQVSGTVDYEPQWLKEQLERNGLSCVLTHIKPERLLDNPAQVAKDHDVFFCEYVGLGSVPGGLNDVNDYNKFREDFLPVARALRENQKLFMFHNHDAEFAKSADGRVFFEHMLKDFTPDEMGITLDTYCVQAAGGDPIWWLEQLKGRVPCVHLKDMIFNKGIKMAPVFEGNMNFEGILAACYEADTKYVLVEQDDTYGEDPFECMKRSYHNIKSRL